MSLFSLIWQTARSRRRWRSRGTIIIVLSIIIIINIINIIVTISSIIIITIMIAIIIKGLFWETLMGTVYWGTWRRNRNIKEKLLQIGGWDTLRQPRAAAHLPRPELLCFVNEATIERPKQRPTRQWHRG